MKLLKLPVANVSALPELLQRRLRAELRAGESLAWVGQPDSHTMFKAAFAMWLFCVPWIGLFAYALLLPLRRKVDALDVFFSIGHVLALLVGLYLLGMPWRTRREAGYTVYAITSERAIVIEGIRMARVTSFPRTPGPHFAFTERKGGTGDVILDMEKRVDSDGDERLVPHGFYAIAEVAKVAALFAALPGAAPNKNL